MQLRLNYNKKIEFNLFTFCFIFHEILYSILYDLTGVVPYSYISLGALENHSLWDQLTHFNFFSFMMETYFLKKIIIINEIYFWNYVYVQVIYKCKYIYKNNGFGNKQSYKLK